jgi:hypothetical protein
LDINNRDLQGESETGVEVTMEEEDTKKLAVRPPNSSLSGACAYKKNLVDYDGCE